MYDNGSALWDTLTWHGLRKNSFKYYLHEEKDWKVIPLGCLTYLNTLYVYSIPWHNCNSPACNFRKQPLLRLWESLLPTASIFNVFSTLDADEEGTNTLPSPAGCASGCVCASLVLRASIVCFWAHQIFKNMLARLQSLADTSITHLNCNIRI